MYNKFDIKSLVNFTKTLKVLYVEDNKEVRDAILALLKNFFDDIVVAEDGEHGFHEFNKNHFDLIISDIRMPKLDGIEMVKMIREISENIPVIVATAHKDTELLISCIEVGVTAYLLKPINFKQLEKTIKQSCEKIYYKKKNEEYELSLEKLVAKRTKELEITKDKLVEMVNRDPLTNLYNRRYFHDISTVLLKLSQREKQHLSALMIDIDRFKNINDIYGHVVGDQVIKNLAKTLLDYTRTSDVVVRFGGEEFVVLFPNTDLEGATLLATKIKHAVENTEIQTDNENNEIVKFTISIGVSECDCINSLNLENLVHRIDEALYEAKRSGRNRIVVYEKKVINV